MPRGQREVDLAPLRAAFLASERSASAVARELGWFERKPDASRVREALGLARSGGRLRQSTSYDRGVALASAIGVDPVDVGV